jgi:AcrR family transcriptional regulator
MDEGIGLPASIEAAWGLRERPGKGPKPGLTLDRIVDAAVRVAATDGLEAVSMSRVATDLGVSTMSLYRYVAAKDELLSLMMDAAFGTPPDEAAPGEGWRDALSVWAWAHLDVLRRHPWVLRIQMTSLPITPHQLEWLERGLGSLQGTGLAEGEKLSVVMLLIGYVRSWAGMATMVTVSSTSSMRDYGRLLAKLTDSERFPALSAVIADGVLDEQDDQSDQDDEFVFGLQRVLDGIDALVRARSHGAPAQQGSRSGDF